MQRLRTESRPVDAIPAEEILEAILVESGAIGEVPTDERKLLSFLQLEQLTFDFAKEITFLSPPSAPPFDLRAALSFNERVVATQSGMGDKRTRFSIFHEIAHYVLPEHVEETFQKKAFLEKTFVDTDKTLSWTTKVRFEREANQFAADLLFQGNRFAEESLSLPLSVKTVLDLAPRYGASYEAALRRYTESQVVPCALVVHDKVARNDESFVEDDDYRIQYTIASPAFRKLYFSGQLTCDPGKASELFQSDQYWKIGQVVETEVVVEGSSTWRFASQAFSNGYKIFQFLVRPVSKRSSSR